MNKFNQILKFVGARVHLPPHGVTLLQIQCFSIIASWILNSFIGQLDSRLYDRLHQICDKSQINIFTYNVLEQHKPNNEFGCLLKGSVVIPTRQSADKGDTAVLTGGGGLITHPVNKQLVSSVVWLILLQLEYSHILPLLTSILTL